MISFFFEDLFVGLDGLMNKNISYYWYGYGKY